MRATCTAVICPWGGDATNSVISAHTGMVNASMFDNLRNLKNGDEVKIEVMGKNLHYGVVGQHASLRNPRRKEESHD